MTEPGTGSGTGGKFNSGRVLLSGRLYLRSIYNLTSLIREMMLRAHMTCHDQDLIRSGLDCFLSTGDVYRRDTIDRTHYPVFHQMDGVRLFSAWELEEFAKDKSTVCFLML